MVIRCRAGRRRWGARDRGAAPVELAILWSVIVLLLFGGIQVSTYFMARSVAQHAAQVGVATARQYDASADDGEARAREFLERAGDWLVGWDVEDVDRNETTGEVTVIVTGESLSIVPLLPPWAVRQSAHGTVERLTLP